MKIAFKFILFLIYISQFTILAAQTESNQGTVVERLLYVIDDRYKENLTLSASRNAFHEIIYQLATTGYKGKTISVFRDSSFQKSISPQDILELGKSEETISYAPDPEYPNDVVDTTIIDLFASSSISRYLILFDSISMPDGGSQYQPIAIAPLYSTSFQGVEIHEKTLFWAKWDDISPLLKTIPFFSAYNKNGRLSYYDYFLNRFFISSALNEKINVE
ncbi:MAG: hypothetical protein H8E61_01930 [Bacteroidetes bacterium]|nr:hypothetical protein [Bacteroidota bacterium]